MQLYTPGKWAAGTPQDAAAMQEAALPCWVFRMRREGDRLPARHVSEPTQVNLLCLNRYDEPDRFVVRLYHPGQFMDFSGELHGARLLRHDKGVHLFVGDEWVASRKQHQLQTLLCTPTAERGWEILRKMAAKEKGPRP